MSTETDWTYTFDKDSDIGKAYWQWQYTTTDPWSNTVPTLSEQVSLTAFAGQEPQCSPGYIANEETSNAQECCTGGCLPLATNCTELACDENNNAIRYLRGG